MRETEIFKYFAFGYNYYLLHYENTGNLIREGKNALLPRITEFLETLDELSLNVTKQAAVGLENLSQKLKKTSKEKKVDAELQGKVGKLLTQIDATLDAELQLRHAYIVTPKRFDTEHLLKHPENLFAPKILTTLPSLCQYDFKEACKCIAFGLPTAAAFHALRGTEGTLRYYYSTIVKRGRVKSLLWGPIINHLRERKDGPPKALLDHLDNIRENFRNPTSHPEARYDMDEVQDLLAVTIDTINRMAKDIVKRNR